MRQVLTCVAILVCGCVSSPGDEPEVELTPGKSDDAMPVEVVEFDAEDPRWVLIEECRGYDLCLDVLVAGRDQRQDSEAYGYPMQRVIDELYWASELRISPNCEGKLGFDSDMNVWCSPEEGDPFMFGLATDQRDGSDSSWQWVQYDYAEPARALLFRDEETDTYYLDVK